MDPLCYDAFKSQTNFLLDRCPDSGVDEMPYLQSLVNNDVWQNESTLANFQRLAATVVYRLSLRVTLDASDTATLAERAALADKRALVVRKLEVLRKHLSIYRRATDIFPEELRIIQWRTGRQKPGKPTLQASAGVLRSIFASWTSDYVPPFPASSSSSPVPAVPSSPKQAPPPPDSSLATSKPRQNTERSVTVVLKTGCSCPCKGSKPSKAASKRVPDRSPISSPRSSSPSPGPPTSPISRFPRTPSPSPTNASPSSVQSRPYVPPHRRNPFTAQFGPGLLPTPPPPILPSSSPPFLSSPVFPVSSPCVPTSFVGPPPSWEELMFYQRLQQVALAFAASRFPQASVDLRSGCAMPWLYPVA